MKILFFTNRKKAVKAHFIILKWLKTRRHKVQFELSKTAQNKVIKINNFDIVILEVNTNDKSVYKIIFDALIKDKPVLMLYEYHDRKPKNLIFPAEKTMLRYLILRGYVLGNLKDVLERFFISLEKGKLERFNFFISKDIEEYLNWIPYGRAQTKSDFIRKIIRDEMDNDEMYGKYKEQNL